MIPRRGDIEACGLHADIDECVSEPCQYGGACYDMQGAFYCRCPARHVGEVCQEGELAVVPAKSERG